MLHVRLILLRVTWELNRTQRRRGPWTAPWCRRWRKQDKPGLVWNQRPADVFLDCRVEQRKKMQSRPQIFEPRTLLLGGVPPDPPTQQTQFSLCGMYCCSCINKSRTLHRKQSCQNVWQTFDGRTFFFSCSVAAIEAWAAFICDHQPSDVPTESAKARIRSETV